MPGREPKTKTIGGAKFSVTPLRWPKGREGLSRLIAVVAPTIGDALSKGASITAVLADAKFAGLLGDMLSALPQRFDEPTLKWFEDAFGACSTAEIGEVKVPLALDSDDKRAMAFEQLGYLAFFQWVVFCLEVNYADFFGELMAALGAAGIITRKAA